MAQIVSGFRAILSHPTIYNLVQNFVGAEKARHILVRDFFPTRHPYRMLDIGCGTAEILRHLPADIDYSGFDASEAYIAHAKLHFGTRGLFRAELVRETTLDDMEPFDLILAFGLLHHLDDDEAGQLFAMASHALKPDGRLITVDPVYSDKQSCIARWIIGKDRGQNVRSLEGYANLARSHFPNVMMQERHDLLNIPYSHCILQCSRA